LNISIKCQLNLDGRLIDVSICDQEKEKTKHRNNVGYIQNLSFKTNEEDLKEFYKNFNVKRVMIIRNARK
jgi:RNA recognition motif-containing protein